MRHVIMFRNKMNLRANKHGINMVQCTAYISALK
jgi:hypothetical protein